jgi:hypothetical protein
MRLRTLKNDYILAFWISASLLASTKLDQRHDSGIYLSFIIVSDQRVPILQFSGAILDSKFGYWLLLPET